MSQNETPADPTRAALELVRQRQDLELAELKSQRNTALDENCSLRAEIALLRAAVKEARTQNENSVKQVQTLNANLASTLDQLASVKEELRLEKEKPVRRKRAAQSPH